MKGGHIAIVGLLLLGQSDTPAQRLDNHGACLSALKTKVSNQGRHIRKLQKQVAFVVKLEERLAEIEAHMPQEESDVGSGEISFFGIGPEFINADLPLADRVDRLEGAVEILSSQHGGQLRRVTRSP